MTSASDTPSDLPTILVVDDELRSRESLSRVLNPEFEVLLADSALEARKLLEQHSVSVILCDQRMPGMSGIEFLKEARERWPQAVRIVLSGYTDSEDIINGINHAGIYQYLLKPWLPDHLLSTVRSAVESQSLQNHMQRLDLELRAGTPVLRRRSQEALTRVREAFDFSRIVRAAGGPLDAICEMAARVARYDLSVLLLGESGTGKELLARGIHYASPRAANAFVMENCAALPDTLLESELFGHKRGAFTGAHQDHIGLFQRANGGTLLLDEIGDTSPAFQVKLLRVLQEGELRPVGASSTVRVDVRVIAATHRDLEEDVRTGRFRSDLYYRLAGVSLALPPLRERSADVLPIAKKLLDDARLELDLPGLNFASDAMANLIGYSWPGNIRELRNEIYRAAALSDGAQINARSFSWRVLQGQARLALAASLPTSSSTGTLQEQLDAIEATLLKESLLRHRWNKTHAARELGLSRVGLRQKLRRFGLEES
ncbi:sigma-54 dependent transcriptional regulator [Pseudomonas sp. 10B1]|uniref:sigma-54-dependent transcriptional regulator n=1 Tax=unclassified Pseudomonas TaxID=196821 RepID=UPI002AB4BD90|nr:MULTISPECIES: sigma-54 dependent transcriptional regulator [unclassified Pseudomonas]MDY7559661.1 sigma-54 dependent transcriptional regulator [Pseudomonas sp. AB6]MEA9977963.1 sigma-54 dependent transcriptional regulator [Pseudomonas sp. RTS4]MEA9993103.1 sigma-54 dependent transcriptional regulator [Pseudomonas sp. AA4]MEB0086045.1 sigma-54 dependent transcriptional regulator [Pseudomonas sp. RTI1]MEB0125519.1 sigma-54 dependent transcriptional regulator [Pseudomonas sp. CCC1.2]